MTDQHNASKNPVQDKNEVLFSLIEKAGGVGLKNIKELTFSEKMKISFNVWAFLFTIFYYIYKKMWKKGVSYFIVTTIVVLLVDEFMPMFEEIVWVIPSVIFATRANMDIYKKEKLDSNGWY
jgi:hypothetical protein